MLGGFFLVLGFLFIVLIVITIWSFTVWSKNKECLALIESEEYEIFDNLKISSISYGKIRSSQGFTIQGKAAISKDTLVFAASRNSIFLFHTEMPLICSKSIGFIPIQLKMNNWNSIMIIVNKEVMSVGRAKIEFLIETSNKEQKEDLYKKIKNWC